MLNLSRLKQAAPLQALALEHLTLKPFGKDLLGLCPFHKEKTPSFRVHETYYYCHGCHIHGDVIDLYAHMHSVSKGRAIHALAERYGVSLEGQRRTRTQRVYDAQESAFAEWWWRRIKDGLAVRLTAFVRYGSEEDADAAGLLWRQTAALDREGRMALAERCATTEERREWEYERSFTWAVA